MDVFAQIEARVAAALEALKAEGALPADVPTAGIEVETPRDPTHGDLSTNAAMVLAKPARMKPRDIADKLQAKLSGAEGVDGRLRRRSGLPQPHAEARGLARPGARHPRCGRRLRPLDDRRRQDGQRRVRVGQPDRADARRPLPRRRVRRCAGQSAGLRRLRRHARILRQRCRRTGGRARPLGVPALPRGAGRGHRRHPGRASIRATT